MESHVLLNELPEYSAKIIELKQKNEDFQKMCVNYEEINALIAHYEEGEQNHTTDEHLTDLRRKRLHLKDAIYEYLHKH